MTPIAAVAPIVLCPRPRVADVQAVYCGHCWEPISRADGGWRHIRTHLPAAWNDKRCVPLCDWPGCPCEADASRSLGTDEWTGSAFRYRAAHFLCADHWITYRRDVGAIVRT